jgi:hypothetical protein
MTKVDHLLNYVLLLVYGYGLSTIFSPEDKHKVRHRLLVFVFGLVIKGFEIWRAECSHPIASNHQCRCHSLLRLALTLSTPHRQIFVDMEYVSPEGLRLDGLFVYLFSYDLLYLF